MHPQNHRPAKQHDPLLIAHLVNPFQFELGSVQFPISIRDQMLRARLLIDRAHAEHLIGEDRPLLVIGAGAAGVTAAIHSARKGIKTTLIEKQGGAFTRQADCATRWICPTQYDWPIDHWERQTFPWRTPDTEPLPWPAAAAQDLASLWNQILVITMDRCRATLETSFDTVLETPLTVSETHLLEGFFLTYPNGYPKKQPSDTSADSSLAEMTEGKTSWEVQRKGPFHFGMAVSCVGLGEEQCNIENSQFEGVKFWQTDQFAQPNMGLAATQPRVLIIGGGDGGLQDFLRCVIDGNKAPKTGDIYRALRPHLENSHQIEKRILSAEDQTQRMYIWNNAEHDHAYLRELHLTYKEIVDEVLGASNGGLHNTLEDLLVPDIGGRTVELAYQCDHFTKCYALNHFLALLVATFLERRTQGKTPLLANRTAIEINGHACAKAKPEECYGKEHHVTLVESRCGQVDASSRAELKICNILIIRRGVKKSDVPMVTNPRQLFPYYLLH